MQFIDGVFSRHGERLISLTRSTYMSQVGFTLLTRAGKCPTSFDQKQDMLILSC